MVHKAFIVQPPNGQPRDLRQIIDIGCAEAKKALRLKQHLNVVDLIMRPYGIVVVVELPQDRGLVAGNNPGVRGGKER